MKNWFPWLIAFVGVVSFLTARPARADVVTYPDGKVLKGIATDIPDDPNSIMLETDLGKIRINKSRVRIVKEAPADGYIEIGQAFRARQKMPEALQAFQKALNIDPANANARKLLDDTQAEVSQQQQMTRQKAVVQIDDLTTQARKLTSQGRFEDAIDLVKQADALVPDPEQKPKLRALLSDIYLGWARERLDKLDKVGAEKQLNLAIAANPDNDEAVSKLLDLWEGDPTKNEQAAAVYETILERHPNDDGMRKKLADIYYSLGRFEDASHHYLILYDKSDKFRGGQLEANLIDCLDRLHRQFARQKDYADAIKYFTILAKIDKDTDATEVLYYQFMQMAGNVDPNDLKGQLNLGQWAEKNGIDQEALRIYRRLVDYKETQDAATAGLMRYAQRTLTDAQTALKIGNYSLAQTLANQLKTDYPKLEKIQESAADIIGQASLKLTEDRRARRERARQLETRANDYYQQAYYNFSNIFSTERENMPILVSSRQEAKKYFGLAIQCYQEVLRIDPTIASDPNSTVNVRLHDSIERLNRLNAPLPPRTSYGLRPRTGS
ncbi:MAG: tetratricopeptide repeat protein [bacterium]|nr:tetratricopeptide repeat protein [bacterium]